MRQETKDKDQANKASARNHGAGGRKPLVILCLASSLLLISLLLPGGGNAEESNIHALNGTVAYQIDNATYPVPDAVVTITDTENNTAYQGITDSGGNFTANLAEGTYNLTIHADYMVDFEAQINITDDTTISGYTGGFAAPANATGEPGTITFYMEIEDGYKEGGGPVPSGTEDSDDQTLNDGAPIGGGSEEGGSIDDPAPGGEESTDGSYDRAEKDDGTVTDDGGGSGGISGLLDQVLQPLVLLGAIILIMASIIYYSYSRITGKAVLNHVTRKAVLNHINQHPGIHFRGIMDALDIKQGSLSHHLKKLEREEFVKARKEGQYKRYYPANMMVETRVHLNIPQQKILVTIKEYPGITLAGIQDRTGLSKKGVYYNSRILGDIGLVYLDKEEGVIRCYPEVQAV